MHPLSLFYAKDSMNWFHEACSTHGEPASSEGAIHSLPYQGKKERKGKRGGRKGGRGEAPTRSPQGYSCIQPDRP